tara:strand:+ start:293 stop:547 length:255 start_codon:yes stop_codon:yes gene_type:complete
MSTHEIQDKIYMFAAEIFAEADKTDLMGEALYAFTEILSTQIDIMSANSEGIDFNFTQIFEILEEQRDTLLAEKAQDPDTPSVH